MTTATAESPVEEQIAALIHWATARYCGTRNVVEVFGSWEDWVQAVRLRMARYPRKPDTKLTTWVVNQVKWAWWTAVRRERLWTDAERARVREERRARRGERRRRDADHTRRVESADEVARLLDSLPPKWRAVLVHSFGLEGETPKRPKATAKVLGLSREAVRQMRKKALAALRALTEQDAV